MNNKELLLKYRDFLNSKRPLDKLVVTKIENHLKLNFICNSNSIEGNTLSLRETQVIIENGITIKGKSLKEHLEVKGQEYAINFLEEEIKYNTKISLGLIRKFHSLIMQGNDPSEIGVFKKYNNKIVGANFETTPHYLVEEKLTDLINEYYDNLNDNNLIEKISKFHSDFEKIHPFSDGNGRTGRILMNFELIKNNFPICIIYGEDRIEYYEALDFSQSKKDYSLIIEFIEKSLLKTFEFYFEQISVDWKKEFNDFCIEDK